ncbi:uncharacterized protein EI90DRAFT_3082437 [Cantharellus anzutake]|uniref:uncharacterized protein n=1 Tax=Cantharellus anzutake TaxID=1750568 RepID=UPI00190455E3|nr:uncharacterized protein EI90DRAFT_3082437 [Cantharellus anzutake]KAF8319167.1 hypothetical protein EI90DRAFT_3082437 [Cantharellus anzutake]
MCMWWYSFTVVRTAVLNVVLSTLWHLHGDLRAVGMRFIAIASVQLLSMGRAFFSLPSCWSRSILRSLFLS